MTQGGIAAAVIGGLLFLFGLVRFNSAESQLVRAFGGSDGTAMFLLFAGGFLAVAGAFAAFNASEAEAKADAGTNKCPSCGRYNYLEATKCEFCGHSLSKLASIDPATTKPEIVNPPTPTPTPSGNSIEQLERLAALKERGMLSDEEFQQQKRKVLG